MTTAPWLSFAVAGLPVTKGNMRQRPGGMGLYDSSKGLTTWMRDVRLRAKVAMAAAGLDPLAGAVTVRFTFRLQQPKTNRDRYPTGEGTGDFDKLARAIADAVAPPPRKRGKPKLAGAVLARTDAQVTDAVIRKRWAPAGTSPGVIVDVWPTEVLDPQAQPTLVPGGAR